MTTDALITTLWVSGMDAKRENHSSVTITLSDCNAIEKTLRSFKRKQRNILGLLERNEHNYHRLGALGSTDMKIIMETLRE